MREANSKAIIGALRVLRDARQAARRGFPEVDAARVAEAGRIVDTISALELVRLLSAQHAVTAELLNP